MKQNWLHYLIGLSALILAAVAGYYIDQNPKNLWSASIIMVAGLFVAVSQYMIIRNKKRK